MKKILFSVLFILAALPLLAQQPIIVTSQVPGVYPSQFNGGTNIIQPASTNFYLKLVSSASGVTNAIPTITWAVSEHPNVGLTLNTFLPSTVCTNGTNIIYLVRSFDNGNSFESTPFMSLTNVLPTALQMVTYGGAYTNTQCYDIGVTNATHLGIMEITSSAPPTAIQSNFMVNLNMNSDLKYTYPAPR